MADPNPIPPSLTSEHVARFWSKIDRRGPDECWPWKAGTFRGGYGQFKVHQADGIRRQVKAHRVSYLLATGKWPTLLICHTCDNPPCCNPAHLFEGTCQVNLADCKQKGRLNAASGEKHRTKKHPELVLKGEEVGNSKLTADQVLTIRAEYRTGKCSQQSLANRYGVSRELISRIMLRKCWRHL